MTSYGRQNNIVITDLKGFKKKFHSEFEARNIFYILIWREQISIVAIFYIPRM